jgi:hypothetical protein
VTDPAAALLEAVRQGDWSAVPPLLDLWEERADPRAALLRHLDERKVDYTTRLLHKLVRGFFPAWEQGKVWAKYHRLAADHWAGRHLVVLPEARQAAEWFCRLAAHALWQPGPVNPRDVASGLRMLREARRLLLLVPTEAEVPS